MNDGNTSLDQFLIDCVETAKRPGTVVNCESVESVNTESESTNVIVAFDNEASSQASLDMRSMLDRLTKETVVSVVDLVAMPNRKLVILGAYGSKNYKIIVQL